VLRSAQVGVLLKVLFCCLLCAGAGRAAGPEAGSSEALSPGCCTAGGWAGLRRSRCVWCCAPGTLQCTDSGWVLRAVAAVPYLKVHAQEVPIPDLFTPNYLPCTIPAVHPVHAVHTASPCSTLTLIWRALALLFCLAGHFGCPSPSGAWSLLSCGDVAGGCSRQIE
jgi:hypothetical protein